MIKAIVDSQKIKNLVETFYQNREDFYSTLIPRIIHDELRKLFMDAVEMVQQGEKLIINVKYSHLEFDNQFVNILFLRDIIKKEKFGTIFGKTTISIEEALTRSKDIENTGHMLVNALIGSLPEPSPHHVQIAEKHLQIYKNLTELEDKIRYHKIALIP